MGITLPGEVLDHIPVRLPDHAGRSSDWNILYRDRRGQASEYCRCVAFDKVRLWSETSACDGSQEHVKKMLLGN